MRIFEITAYNMKTLIDRSFYIGLSLEGDIQIEYEGRIFVFKISNFLYCVDDIRVSIDNCHSMSYWLYGCRFGFVFDSGIPHFFINSVEGRFDFNVEEYQDLRDIIVNIIDAIEFIDENYEELRTKQRDLIEKGVLKYNE